MTTSLMNTLLSKLLILYALRRVKTKYDFFVEGDDNILASEEDVSEHILNTCHGLGF